MATTYESDKTFGGSFVSPGSYFISHASITPETAKIDGVEKEYDKLQLHLKHIQDNGTAGGDVETTLSLNGCWRARRGTDGKRYIASGSFYNKLIEACSGKSFSATRDYINANLANKKITLSYDEYPSQQGGWGRVPKCDITL